MTIGRHSGVHVSVDRSAGIEFTKFVATITSAAWMLWPALLRCVLRRKQGGSSLVREWTKDKTPRRRQHSAARAVRSKIHSDSPQDRAARPRPNLHRLGAAQTRQQQSAFAQRQPAPYQPWPAPWHARVSSFVYVLESLAGRSPMPRVTLDKWQYPF